MTILHFENFVTEKLNLTKLLFFFEIRPPDVAGNGSGDCERACTLETSGGGISYFLTKDKTARSSSISRWNWPINISAIFRLVGRNRSVHTLTSGTLCSRNRIEISMDVFQNIDRFP